MSLALLTRSLVGCAGSRADVTWAKSEYDDEHEHPSFVGPGSSLPEAED